jgi:hypothetical protein
MVVFTGVTVVDVEVGKLVPGRAVVVTGPKTAAVVPAEGFDPPQWATVVPAAGKSLMPGLLDMHVHHDFPWPGLLDVALANGVTGVRDMISTPFVLAWREEIRAGKPLGPRIVAAGRIDARRNGQPLRSATADTPDEGRKLVRAWKQEQRLQHLEPNHVRVRDPEILRRRLDVVHDDERFTDFIAGRSSGFSEQRLQENPDTEPAREHLECSRLENGLASALDPGGFLRFISRADENELVVSAPARTETKRPAEQPAGRDVSSEGRLISSVSASPWGGAGPTPW